ncbi:O-antigen ligase family protein [Deltaproteobacteria bacterium TL4]
MPKVWKLKTETAILVICLYLIPFSNLPWFAFVPISGLRNVLISEISLVIHPFILLLLIKKSLFNQFPLKLPKHPAFKLLLCYIVWIWVSGVANFPSISTNFFYDRNGIQKFIISYISIIVSCSVTLSLYNLMFFTRLELRDIRRYITMPLGFVLLFAVIEVGNMFFKGWISEVFQIIYPIFHYTISQQSRIHSVAIEASFIGMYIAFILPWIYSYFLESSKRVRFKWIIIFIFTLLLILLSTSRTSYFTTILLTLLFWGLYPNRRIKLTAVGIFVFLIPMLVLILQQSLDMEAYQYFNIYDIITSLNRTDTAYSGSNIMRFLPQVAAGNMFMDNPIFGVGFDQFGFSFYQYAPSWLYTDEVAALMLKDRILMSPNSIFASNLAELGLIGFLIHISIFGWTLKDVYLRYKLNTRTHKNPDIMGLSLLTSICGCLLAGFNNAMIRYTPLWLLLGVAWYYIEKRQD